MGNIKESISNSQSKNPIYIFGEKCVICLTNENPNELMAQQNCCKKFVHLRCYRKYNDLFGNKPEKGCHICIENVI